MAESRRSSAAPDLRRRKSYRANSVEEARIRRAAAAAGLRVGTWVRMAAMKAPPSLHVEDRQRLDNLVRELRAIGVNLNQLVHLAHCRKIATDRHFRDALRRLVRKLAETRSAVEERR